MLNIAGFFKVSKYILDSGTFSECTGLSGNTLGVSVCTMELINKGIPPFCRSILCGNTLGVSVCTMELIKKGIPPFLSYYMCMKLA